jgi:hypothetical protein
MMRRGKKKGRRGAGENFVRMAAASAFGGKICLVTWCGALNIYNIYIQQLRII